MDSLRKLGLTEESYATRWDFMQRRFTERRVNANVEWYFVIGQCHGNGALLDVGVDGAFSETCLHKVPTL